MKLSPRVATSIPAAVSLVSLEPVSVVFAALTFFREVPSRLEKIGVLLATIDAAVIAFAAGTGEHKLAGDLLVLGSVALFGFYVAAARAICHALPPQHAGSMIYAVAALTILIVLPYAGAFTNVAVLSNTFVLGHRGHCVDSDDHWAHVRASGSTYTSTGHRFIGFAG